ncbi:hypothetical protein KKB55_13665 [Myxococcota bacterium]|nr:hypothetical protein [Myxococcota bacterium]MBU1898782.1 hypothetical protein [Myxococcota bacterium]
MRKTHRLTLLLLINASLSHAAPQRLRIAARIGEAGVARFGPVEARKGQSVTLYAVLTQGKIYYTDAPALKDPHQIDKARIRPFKESKYTSLKWSQIEPLPHHTKTASPNFGNPAYSNAKLFGKEHGKWLGYDKIEYKKTELDHKLSNFTIKEIIPSDPWPKTQGLGTMRYQIEVEGLNWRQKTDGVEATERGGIKTTVFRVSYRDRDDWVGWLTSYFNVPNVFGSAGMGRRHQTDKHQGADCADVIIGGLRKAGARIEYTSVTGLYRLATPITEILLLNSEGLFKTDKLGAPLEAQRLRFGSEIQRGDIMVINYAGLPISKRLWDHVAVVGDDQGEEGIFDPKDPVYHMGYLYGLTEEEAGEGWPKYVQFLRLKQKHLKDIKKKTIN